MIATVGTPNTMPAKPNIPLARMIAITTQIGEMPMESPRIWGPITFPSSCWRRNTKIINRSSLSGATMKTMMPPIMPPKTGPKVGTIFVNYLAYKKAAEGLVCVSEQTDRVKVSTS